MKTALAAISLPFFIFVSCRSSKPNSNYESVNKLTLIKKYCPTKEKLFSNYQIDLRAADLRNGETIAEVGAFDGVWTGIYSVFTDSMTFYIEDITSEGFSRNDSIMDYCAILRGNKGSYTVTKVIGSDSTTNLPEKTFDKIICNESFHHFTRADLMLADIKRKLKPGGKLFIRDSLAKKKMNKQPHFHYTHQELLEVLKTNGFEITSDYSGKKMAYITAIVHH